MIGIVTKARLLRAATIFREEGIKLNVSSRPKAVVVSLGKRTFRNV